MPSRELAPKGRVEGLRKKLEDYAKEHGLFINESATWKIEWMEEHEGRCYCDWENRFCPCKHIQEDLITFSGVCHCAVLCTKEKHEYYLKKAKLAKPIGATQKENQLFKKQEESLRRLRQAGATLVGERLAPSYERRKPTRKEAMQLLAKEKIRRVWIEKRKKREF